MRRLALIAALIVLAPGSARAAETVPGDTCGVFPYVTNTWQMAGATQNGGVVNGMFCDGAHWKGVVNFQSSGNVGIGTTAPTAQLHVSATGSASTTIRAVSDTGAPISALLSSGTSSGHVAIFGNAVGAGNLGVEGTVNNTNSIGVYGLNSASASTGGIGVKGSSGSTTTPYGVYGTAPAANNTGYGGYFLNNSATGWSLYADGTSPNYFNGKVGIGTTTPAAPLHVNGEAIVGMQALACAAGTAGAIRYNSGTSKVQFCNGASWADVASGVTASPAGSNKQVQLNDHGILYASSGLTFNSASGILAVAGKVGIGAAAPTHTLEVSGNATMTNTANGGTAIAGIESSVGSGNFGVYGSSTGTSSAGIYGTAGWNSYGGQFNNSYTGASGNQIALYASSSQPAGIGVYALCQGLGGQPCSYAAIKGEISGANNPANTAKAVYGINDPSPTSTGTNWGGYFETTSTGAGTGVTGVESGASNTGYAGYFTNNSATGWGVYSSGTGPNYFAGKVGIGQTTPSEVLDVNGNIGIEGTKSLCFIQGGCASAYIDENWGIRIHGGASNPAQIMSSSLLVGYTASGSNYGTGNLLVSGWVGIGTNAPSVALEVVGDIKYSGLLTHTSDRRLKDNIAPLGPQLGKIAALQPVSFTMKADKERRTEFGLIAQDAETVYPNLVVTAPDGTKSLAYSGLIAPLIEAAKEEQAEINQLRAMLAAVVLGGSFLFWRTRTK